MWNKNIYELLNLHEMKYNNDKWRIMNDLELSFFLFVGLLKIRGNKYY